ncbi:hypothetical protein PC9H_001477 [Pleurotus ostreatus]|uniref:Cytokinin riboside 5'-monophosphate phosphoribohydrolase n=1 Tax=Pleurotus ostreatus TaxID=5322 RepID=A0A8H7DYR1_PLEOS|nr:uncharacterized protein PC9H_001477 [Pleurotus ostreatus]KAF7441128.1 hypothetical protein PC9H_001477 [Pleurotus ostreatus]
MTVPSTLSEPVAVYCASSMGRKDAYRLAAVSVGHALAEANRPLVYGGGSKGIMGVVSGAALEKGGRVTGVVPYPMLVAGGEQDKTSPSKIRLNEKGREKIIVDTMHERKVEMARRSCAFIGLPGGFGTFEEIMEVTTWTQLGIHNKPVILLNVHSYWEPIRSMIQTAVDEGFVQPHNAALVSFVNGPGPDASTEEHENFDWGRAAIKVIENWKRDPGECPYDWTASRSGGEKDELDAI